MKNKQAGRPEVKIKKKKKQEPDVRKLMSKEKIVNN